MARQKAQEQGPGAARKKRAAIYCRVSTADQATDEKISLGEQLADCEAQCAAQGYEVVARYRDVKSGTTSKRPDFQRMIHDASEGAFDVIVCWKVDRLGRGLFPMARLLEVCEPNGVTIEAVKEKVDQRYLGLFASVGKIELDNIRERTMSARLAYARRGKVPNGMARYGYRVTDDGEPAIKEDEERVLLDVAKRYAGGEPLVAICRDLRARNVPSRSPHQRKHGMAWPDAYVAKLLADEAYYTGRRHYAGETIPYPPIFDAALWEAVKRRRALNAYRATRHTKVEYLLQHLLWCRCCGLGFTGRTQRFYYSHLRKDGMRTRYVKATPKRDYACVGSVEYKDAHSCRKPAFLNADRLEQAVCDRLTDALRHPETLLEGIRARLDALEERAHDEVGEVGEVDADRLLAQLKQQRLEYLRQRSRGKMDDAEFDVLTGELDAQMAYLTERAEAEQRLRADVDAQRQVLEHAAAYIQNLSAQVGPAVASLPFAERRKLLLALVDRIWVDADNHLTVDGVLSDETPLSGDHYVNCSTALSRASM